MYIYCTVEYSSQINNKSVYIFCYTQLSSVHNTEKTVVALASPAVLSALHVYTPASSIDTLYSMRVPFVSTTCLSLDINGINSLYHAMSGRGLPVAKHLSKAVSPGWACTRGDESAISGGATQYRNKFQCISHSSNNNIIMNITYNHDANFTGHVVLHLNSHIFSLKGPIPTI